MLGWTRRRNLAGLFERVKISLAETGPTLYYRLKKIKGEKTYE